MELTTVQQILLIILTSALAILLILSIIATVIVIKLLKTIRQITDKAEKVVQSAEAVGDVFKNAAGPVGLLHVLQNLVRMIMKEKKRRSIR